MISNSRYIHSVFIALFFFCSLIKADTPVSNIVVKLETIGTRLEWINYRLNLEQWEFHVNGTSDSLTFYQDLYRYLLSDPEPFKNLPVTMVGITDKEQKHRLRLLLAKLLPDRISFQPEISSLHDSLNDLINDFHSDLQGQVLPLEQLNKMYRVSRNRMEREYAFRAANALGDTISYGMSRIFELRNRESAKLGYQNYFDMVASQTPLG